MNLSYCYLRLISNGKLTGRTNAQESCADFNAEFYNLMLYTTASSRLLVPFDLEEFDVIVVGGGNAGLCAALAASSHVDRVLLVEKAPIGDRGGNTKYTRDVRFAHDDNPFTTGPYSDEEFLDDILKVTARGTNLELNGWRGRGFGGRDR